jgi:Domain of unknown function (DUF1877)
MSSQGVHFALTDAQAQAILAVRDDDELIEMLEEIEEVWDEEYLAESDKAWDAIHRCLTNGLLLYVSEPYPLNHCICGGQQLYEGDDATISFVSAAQVKDVATALAQVSEEWFQERYLAIPEGEYKELSEEDFQYTWKWFERVRGLYEKAAATDRAVIFTVDS